MIPRCSNFSIIRSSRNSSWPFRKHRTEQFTFQNKRHLQKCHRTCVSSSAHSSEKIRQKQAFSTALKNDHLHEKEGKPEDSSVRKFSVDMSMSTSSVDSRLHPEEKNRASVDVLAESRPYKTHSTFELIRSIIVLRSCQIIGKFPSTLGCVEHIFANRENFPLISQFFSFVIKNTAYAHFCGGENIKEVTNKSSKLWEQGKIGAILDYAAEQTTKDDDKKEDKKEETIFFDLPGTYPSNQPARTYDYESEVACDRHVESFMACISAANSISSENNTKSFAALKVTALGNPLLLERMSSTIVEARNLFTKFDTNKSGKISHSEFDEGYRLFFKDAEEKLPRMFERLDPCNSGRIDYIAWSKLLSPADLPRIVSKCRSVGPLSRATLTEKELGLVSAMYDRIHKIAEEAARTNTRLLIDAEQTYYQPAIDNIAHNLQQKYNNVSRSPDGPIIFNTYQCYLQCTTQNLENDIERAQRYNYHFGAKLVRGAYMIGERKRALEMGYPSPIYDTKEDTDACYDKSLKYVLSHRALHDTKSECMMGTHNQKSIEYTIEIMKKLGISPSSGAIHFAQLLGMCDNLTYPLGNSGHSVYKYMPYGKVDEVIPYLLRRAQENSDIFSNSVIEQKSMLNELYQRL